MIRVLSDKGFMLDLKIDSSGKIFNYNNKLGISIDSGISPVVGKWH